MADFTWVGGTSSNFGTASNWNPAQVPGYGTIGVPVGTSISLSSNVTINNIDLTGGAGTVTFTGAYTIGFNNAVPLSAGQGIALGATTTLGLQSGFSPTGTGDFTLSGGTVTESGSVALSAGQNLELTDTNFTSSSPFTGAGTVTLNGSTATFTGSTPGVTVNFATVANSGTQNSLVVPSYSSGTVVTGFSYGDSISVGGAALQLVPTGTSGSGLTIYTLKGTGTNPPSYGSVTLAPGTPGANGGTVPITLTNSSGENTYPCFYPGTMLATAEGEIAVEHVTIGTMLKTVSGALLPVCWVGWSQVSTMFADPLRVLPIRIQADALAEGVPVRDLLVSPDHAVCIDGVLVQAAALVNGTSIFREENVPESFRYYHVELATHELLLADGCPAESFVDNIDRMNFHNWDVREAPDTAVEEMALPRAKSARQVPGTILSAITARAVQFVNTPAA